MIENLDASEVELTTGLIQKLFHRPVDYATIHSDIQVAFGCVEIKFTVYGNL